MKRCLSILLLSGFCLSQASLAAETNTVKATVKHSYTSVKGQMIPVYRYGSGESEYIFLFGVFHGDEPQGAYMLTQLMAMLDQNPAYYLNKSVFIVPVVNPDGLQKNTRVNANLVDLNRNFPTKDFKSHLNRGTRYYAGPKALSEPESQLVHTLLKPYLQDKNKIKILSIHAPLAVNNYDGPAQALADRIKKYNAYPVSSDIGYSTPGSFGTFYGKEQGIRVITLETSKESPQAAWNRHQKALLALLQYPDSNLFPLLPTPIPSSSLEPEPGPSPVPMPEETPMSTSMPEATAEPSASPVTLLNTEVVFSPVPVASSHLWWPLRPVASPLPTPEPTPIPTPEPTATPLPLPSYSPTPQPTATPYAPGKIKVPPLSKQVVLKISKKTQLLTVIDKNKTIVQFPVSTGRGTNNTPNGSFQIISKVMFPSYNGSSHLGKNYYPPKHPHNPLGSRWMQLNAWHWRTRAMLGIHGTDEPLGIGKAVSAGCIRMHNGDVEALFNALPVGAKVIISEE